MLCGTQNKFKLCALLCFAVSQTTFVHVLEKKIRAIGSFSFRLCSFCGSYARMTAHVLCASTVTINRGVLTHWLVNLQLPWQLYNDVSTCSVCSSKFKKNSKEGQKWLLTHPPVSGQLPWQLCQPAQTFPPSQPSGRRLQRPGPAPPQRQREPPSRSAPQTWPAPAHHQPMHPLCTACLQYSNTGSPGGLSPWSA